MSVSVNNDNCEPPWSCLYNHALFVNKVKVQIGYHGNMKAL